MANHESQATSDERRFRIGVGYDIHRLAAGRPLILGGVEIPHNKGLLGHSDGDALLHAIADAMLGAAALGDIGEHFPDTGPEFKNADSKKLLGSVVTLIGQKGFVPVNVDANIIAQEPRFLTYINSIRESIATILHVPVDAVSVKARTNEGLDAIGRGEAIAVQVVVLVEKG